MIRYVQLFTLVLNGDGYVAYHLVPEDDDLLKNNDGLFIKRFVSGDYDCTRAMTQDYKDMEELLEVFVCHMYALEEGGVVVPNLPDGCVVVKQYWRHLTF